MHQHKHLCAGPETVFLLGAGKIRGFRFDDGFTVAVAVALGLLDLSSLLLKVSLTLGDISFWTDLVRTLTTPC